MESWQLLPQELRLMIFEMLADDPAAEGGTEHPLAHYSLVCRDWQIVFERHLYRHLALDQDSLWDFEHIVCRQRRFVEHIRLTIGMETFECFGCTRFEMAFLARENVLVSDTIVQLFQILSRWRPVVDSPKGLTLEITGYSRTTDGCIRVTPDPFNRLNDPQIPFEHLNPHFRRDDLGLRLHVDFGRGLALVQVVRKLVVPRKSRYRLSRAIKTMIQSLPNLDHRTVIHDNGELGTVVGNGRWN